MMVSLFSLFVTGCELPAIDRRLTAQIQEPAVVSTDDEPAAQADSSLPAVTSETTRPA